MLKMLNSTNSMMHPHSKDFRRTYIIYESRGRAREYCELAANLYSGCEHNCVYCYAPLALKRTRDTFSQVQIRSNVLSKFKNDAEILMARKEDRPILLSFTTDPYQPIDIFQKLTRNAIQILHDHGLKVSILTKGGARAERDFDLLASSPDLSEFGTTLVFLDEKNRTEIEPGASPTQERIETIKKAHKKGIFTYVSLEPVWFPEDALKIIDLTHEFVDRYKVGKLNYHPQAKNVNWRRFREDVVERLERFGNDFYIKKDLLNSI